MFKLAQYQQWRVGAVISRQAMYFEIGEKVVCINANDYNGFPVLFLKEREIYTVKGFDNCKCGLFALVLEEIPGEIICGQRCNCGRPVKIRAYAHWRFRKMDYNFAHQIIAILQKHPVENEADFACL